MNIEYLQAELTIVNTSQTKHLIPCFQYEFDIQQYSTTPGGQCWGSDPQCRGRWKDWYYHDVGHETSIAMVRKYKRVQVVLCQDVQRLGWATCQRLSPNPDTLFYKFSNDVPVHRLFLDLRCDERSTPTHPVPSVWHASSRYTDSTNLPYPRLYISSKVTHIQQPPSFLPPGYYGLLSCIKITRLGSSSQSTMCWLIRAESSLALGKVFFYFLNSLFLKNSFQVPWGVRVESMPIAYSS